jgi:hypothetical protein
VLTLHAESNLSLAPRLHELQAAVAERQQRVAAQRRSYEAASDQFQRLAASYSPQSICVSHLTSRQQVKCTSKANWLLIIPQLVLAQEH